MQYRDLINVLKERLSKHVRIILPDPLPDGLITVGYEPIYDTGNVWVVGNDTSRENIVQLLFEQSRNDVWKSTGLRVSAIYIACDIAVSECIFHKITEPVK